VIRARRVADLDALIRDRVQRPLVIALDGRSGTGKSTLAAELAGTHDGVVITADDFYVGDDRWRSLEAAERASRVIDWRRLRAEVLEPLRAGRPASWQTFDWGRGGGLTERRLSAARVRPRESFDVVLDRVG
jgi:para-aminobenzoate synthetase